MRNEKMQAEKRAAGADTESGPMRGQFFEWAQRAWRPAGTVVAVGLALLLTWHVINGKHGLSVWQQNRAEDRQLQMEINDLEQENAQLRNHIERLKSDPEAIEREAREKLHYARPGEVIVALPAQPQTQTAGTGSR